LDRLELADGDAGRVRIMTARYLPEFLTQAKRLGFTLDGHTGSGHHRLQNADGAVVVIPSTPSDWRSCRNSLAQLERLAGERLPRANAGKYRHHRQSQLDVHRSPTEIEKSGEVDDLVAEADALQQRFAELVATPSRAAAAEARSVLERHEHIRRLLAQNHRIIDPIGRAS
jgi:hypothetical protein